MSHSFSFCIKEYTIKQGSNGLSFSLGNTMVVLFGDLFVVLYTIYNDVWRHLSASLLTTFIWRHLTSSNTQLLEMKNEM